MPFRFFKKVFGGENEPTREPTPTERPLSFKARVAGFWRWFAANELRLYDSLQQRDLDDDELVAHINAAAPMLAWELCPSPEDGKEGFAFSGEGSASNRLLAHYMVERAPALQRWTLFTSKQASPNVADACVNIGMDEDFAFSDFRFGIDFDQEEQRLELSVHHPRFGELPEESRTQLTFLALDNALGENLIEAWVGPIEPTPELSPEQKYRIDELRRQAKAALSLHDLNADVDPKDLWISYQSEKAGDGDVIARADVITGTTGNMEPLQGITDPDYEDDLEGSGACFAYVMLPRSDLADGREVDQRSQIEDLLGTTLRDAGVGDFFGGAMGLQYAYVDLVLFDEPAGIELIRQAIPSVTFASRASLRYFAPNRRDEYVALLGT